MENHSWEVILALAGVVQALTGGIIKYLLSQIDKRDLTIRDLTAAQTASNLTNAKLAEQVPGLIADRDAARRRTEV